jgi:predicted metal-dependent phosphoesterase TrpH
MYKIDLHVHTCYSKDSWLSFGSLISTAEKKGLNCLAITDHNTIQGAIKLKKIAPFKVIIGEEITTQEGEIIGYFLKNEIPTHLSLEATINQIKNQGGLVAIPHPFDKARRCRIKKQALQKIIEQVDLIEVYNARTVWPGAEKKAQKLAQKMGLFQTAGSDAHTHFELGRAFLEIEDFNGPEDFLRQLNSAKLFCQPSPLWVYAISGLAKVSTKVRTFCRIPSKKAR